MLLLNCVVLLALNMSVTGMPTLKPSVTGRCVSEFCAHSETALSNAIVVTVDLRYIVTPQNNIDLLLLKNTFQN